MTPVPGGYEQDQRTDYVTGSAQAVIKVALLRTLIDGIACSKPGTRQQVYDGALQSYDPGNQADYRGALVKEPARGLNLYAS